MCFSNIRYRNKLKTGEVDLLKFVSKDEFLAELQNNSLSLEVNEKDFDSVFVMADRFFLSISGKEEIYKIIDC